MGSFLLFRIFFEGGKIIDRRLEDSPDLGYPKSGLCHLLTAVDFNGNL